MPDTEYQAVLLPEDPAPEDLRAIVPDYRTMLLTVMEAIADRYDRSPDYPFIDTKLDLITGEDFPDDDPLRGKNAVYGWIQGRGLEALVGHCRWMRRHRIGQDLLPRLERMARDVLNRLDELRTRNAGHLFFFMQPDGTPFALDEAGAPRPFVPTADAPHNFSDLFCAKGMYAAARYFEDAGATDRALAYCRQVSDAVFRGTFVSDHQPLDPKNPVLPVPGRHTHGHYMIQIGAAALMVERGEVPEGLELGLRLIRHELAHYVNLDDRVPELAEGDLWEAIDDAGAPYREGDRILSDPGHALECVGLVLKFTSAAKAQAPAASDLSAEIAEIEAVMPRVLQRNFANGFLRGPGGICKAFDLLSRTPINTDMPWWNLPETMRAAVYCHRVAETDADRRMCIHVLRDCHNAFVQHFVRPDLYLMAYQTRSETGDVIPVIPATADADPGYHTGLSIIDMLDVLEA